MGNAQAYGFVSELILRSTKRNRIEYPKDFSTKSIETLWEASGLLASFKRAIREFNLRESKSGFSTTNLSATGISTGGLSPRIFDGNFRIIKVLDCRSQIVDASTANKVNDYWGTF